MASNIIKPANIQYPASGIQWEMASVEGLLLFRSLLSRTDGAVCLEKL